MSDLHSDFRGRTRSQKLREDNTNFVAAEERIVQPGPGRFGFARKAQNRQSSGMGHGTQFPRGFPLFLSGLKITVT